MLDSGLQSSVTRRRLLQYGGVGCVALALPHRLQAGESLSLGAMHNQTLDWFVTTEKPLQVNPDGTLPMGEFKRCLNSTMTYASFAYDVSFDVDRNLEIAIKTTQRLGLVELESKFGPAIKNSNRLFYTSMIDSMKSQGAISRRLTNELQQLHQLAERSQDGRVYTNVVFKRLLGQYWDETDQNVVNDYLDVYAHSAAYWQEVQDSDPQAFRRKWWLIVGADVLGVVGGAIVGGLGFGVVGAVVGGTAFGAGFSAVASTW